MNISILQSYYQNAKSSWQNLCFLYQEQAKQWFRFLHTLVRNMPPEAQWMNACMTVGMSTAFKHRSLILLKSRMPKHPWRTASSEPVLSSLKTQWKYKPVSTTRLLPTFPHSCFLLSLNPFQRSWENSFCYGSQPFMGLFLYMPNNKYFRLCDVMSVTATHLSYGRAKAAICDI